MAFILDMGNIYSATKQTDYGVFGARKSGVSRRIFEFAKMLVRLLGDACPPKPRIEFVLALALLLPGWAEAQTVGERVYKKVAPAIVTITAGKSSGTGFLVRDKRTFVTAAHVIENGEIPVVQFGKGSFLKVEGIAFSKEHDLAILRTEDEVNAKPILLGDREPVSTGAQVFAIGTALGALSHTMTDGMLSGLRSNGDVDLVQVSSPFSPGMSGGPVLNKDGKAIGVISFSFTDGQNLNIAVATKHVRELLASELRDAETVCEELRQSAAGKKLPATSDKDSREFSLNRQQALADLISEVRRWTFAAIDDCEGIYYESGTITDRETLARAVERAQKQLPLITVGGVVQQPDISDRIVAHCREVEWKMLRHYIRELNNALSEASSEFCEAIIEKNSRAVPKEKADASFKKARQALGRVLLGWIPFEDWVKHLFGEGDFYDKVNPYYFSFNSTALGVKPDPEHPELAAIKWIDPSQKTNLRVGDVITGLRKTSDSDWIPIETWKDVYNFLRTLKFRRNVDVKLLGGGKVTLPNVEP